ncbi:type III secretion system chaperone [Microbulbifer sp. CNSA002]|uniref:type III secretion system chaperone n=1 Tax=unclassified Microbulbifer TaxID=2619833 RepID=UPI0039B533A9
MKLDFSQLIQELAVNLQQPLMDQIEDACRISWDNIDMHIYYHEEDQGELVIITIDIGEIPHGQDEHFATLMLQANYLWIASEYATLSLNPETQKVVLCDKERAESIEIESFTRRVKSLYQAAIYWQGVLSSSPNVEQTDQSLGAIGMENNFGIKV